MRPLPSTVVLVNHQSGGRLAPPPPAQEVAAVTGVGVSWLDLKEARTLGCGWNPDLCGPELGAPG